MFKGRVNRLAILGGAFLICLNVLGSGNIEARDKVVYGVDNRLDVEDSPFPLYQEWARSTAAMIRADKMKTLENGLFMEIKIEKNFLNLCKEEKFSDQAMVANCSGFLVGPDLLVTAGHCFNSPTACADYQWVFDYRTDVIGREGPPLVPVGDVYSCKSVVARAMEFDTKMDYAVVRLDRKVKERKPLPYRQSGKVDIGEEMVVIGHPSGLPMKVTDGAFVRGNDQDAFFVMNADTFQGNSGSAVFNAHTGVVEGILVRGDKDYVYNFEKQCYTVNYCQTDGCRGEDATRMAKIPFLSGNP